MPIRITGLNSGLDTESIISALVSSYSYKTSKYKKAQTKLSWKQEAWSTLNSKVYSFYNNVGKLKLSSAYNMRTASVSDSTKAKVSAASGATNGVQSLEVLEVAKVIILPAERFRSKTHPVRKIRQKPFHRHPL